MKTSPKFLISGTKHAKTDGFFTLLMKNSLTQKYWCSVELSGLVHSVFSLGRLNFCYRRLSSPGQKDLSSPKQAQAKK